MAHGDAATTGKFARKKKAGNALNKGNRTTLQTAHTDLLFANAAAASLLAPTVAEKKRRKQDLREDEQAMLTEQAALLGEEDETSVQFTLPSEERAKYISTEATCDERSVSWIY